MSLNNFMHLFRLLLHLYILHLSLLLITFDYFHYMLHLYNLVLLLISYLSYNLMSYFHFHYLIGGLHPLLLLLYMFTHSFYYYLNTLHMFLMLPMSVHFHYMSKYYNFRLSLSVPDLLSMFNSHMLYYSFLMPLIHLVLSYTFMLLNYYLLSLSLIHSSLYMLGFHLLPATTHAIAYVNVGALHPYVMLLFSAVTVTAFFVIVNAFDPQLFVL